MNYPYPILRTTPLDYKKSTFNVEIKKESTKEGFKISVEYNVENSMIKELIEKKILAYAVQIQCISTWYRDLVISDSEQQEILIPSEKVHERVDLCPCIIATEKIENFTNDDFTEDFDGISYVINKGEVVAIGERQRFDAIYKDDIIKKGEPIVSFVEDNNTAVMFCEWEYNIIRIHLPKEKKKKYVEIGKYEPWKIPVLNAIYVVPVIVQGINEIYKDVEEGGDGSLSGYSWYKTLKIFIMKAAKDDATKFRKMLSDPIKTAQLLLNDNSSQALDVLGGATRQI